MISLWGFHPVQEISAKKKKKRTHLMWHSTCSETFTTLKSQVEKRSPCSVLQLSIFKFQLVSAGKHLHNSFQYTTKHHHKETLWCLMLECPDVECTLHLWEKAHRALGLSKKVIIHFLRLDVNDELCFFLNHWISCIWAQGHHAMQYGICNYNRCLFQESEGLPCQALHFHLTSHETWMDMDMDRIMDSIPIL